jgi:signal transduction histidine kinase
VDEVALLRHELEQERRARKAAEALLEEKSRVLHDATQVLSDANATLEDRVHEWTREVQATHEALRRRAEELNRSQLHLARAQRIAGIGSFERDLCTDEVIWSDETYRIFGIVPGTTPPTRQEMLAFVHPDDRAIIETSIATHEKGLPAPPVEFRIRCRDGTIKWLYLELDVILDYEGNSARRIGTLRDVTELRVAAASQKELQRQLQHSQKLEALGTLAGGVAHDLNNTLVPIVALSKLALDDLPEHSRVRADIETIIRASERAGDLVKKILAFSRRQELLKQEVDLALITLEALQMLRASLPASIEIVQQISKVPALFGDAGELYQVIVNLVTNAAQAIGGRIGRITVRLWPSCEIQTSSHTGEARPAVCLSVADTGCGMDEATRDRIFEPFFTTKGAGKGTGLGLSLVHGIVAGHGGQVTVRSTLGEGTEFTLSLPALDHHPATAQLEAAS